MMPETPDKFDGDYQPLKSEATGNDDRPQDASNSDAAANNARESERMQETSRAEASSSQADAERAERQKQDTGNRANIHENEVPATTQGTEEEIEENLSGSTNLSLDQLKKERDPGGHPLEGEDRNVRD